MVIWTRWGILGLLIPTALIVIAMISAETYTKLRFAGEGRKPVKQAPVADGTDEPPREDEAEEAKAAERQRAEEEQKRAEDRDKAIKRAKDTGYLIGGVWSAALLWPLGRWMNASESRVLMDRPSGQVVEPQGGGGHTMFFIPLEFWGSIWAAIGLCKFFG